MQISHIVLLQFKPDVASDIKEDVASRIKGLKDSCMHPETGQPYIVSMKGGVDASIEGLQNGVSHAFVSVFENASDRDYFAKTDPVHIALVQDVLQYLERVQVVDFVDGQLI